MTQLPDLDRGYREGIRDAVTWLHARAAEMRDWHAQLVLNAAATNLGWVRAHRRSARRIGIPEQVVTSTAGADAPISDLGRTAYEAWISASKERAPVLELWRTMPEFARENWGRVEAAVLSGAPILANDAELEANPLLHIRHLEQQCRNFIQERNEWKAVADREAAEVVRLREMATDMRERAAKACEAAAEAADELSETTNQNGVPDLSFAWGCAAEACRNRAAAIRALPLNAEDDAPATAPIALLPDLRLPRA